MSKHSPVSTNLWSKRAFISVLTRLRHLSFLLIFLVSMAGVPLIQVEAAEVNSTGEELLGRPTDTSIITNLIPGVNNAPTWASRLYATAPLVSDIPDQTIDEGGTFTTINLDGYVSDDLTTAANMIWNYSGNSELSVSIVDRVATITTPNANWNGAETITFTATDEEGLSNADPATFTVNAVNDAPVVSDIPDQTIDEGASFTTINLDNYVSDVDNSAADMTWTPSGNSQLGVDIKKQEATITIPNLDWNGAETITFTATDPGGLSAADTATFTVTAINDAPVVGNIPNQNIAEGDAFATINLDDYVSDVDNPDADMIWTSSGNIQLGVDITDRIATITTPNIDWNGTETITFRATDPGTLYNEDAATFRVTAVNDAPVVSDIPNQTVAEGTLFTTINLDDYVSDVDNTDAEMTWTPSGNSQLGVSIVNRVATITTPNVDWNGAETITFTATDPGGAFASDAATFTVTGVNDAPVVSDIPNQTVAEGTLFTTINLDDYVSDVDNTDAEMTWTPSGNSQLGVSIVNRVATITTPNANWNGSETITFTATDPGGASASDATTFTVTGVNDTPVVSDIPDQTVAEGTSFTTINLDNYVSDVDNSAAEMSWGASVATNLNVDITNRVATITPLNSNWNGAETITFTATDPGGLSAQDTATFTVTGVNDAPVVSDIPNQTVAEGTLFTTINLDDYVSDADNTDAEMTWTPSGNSQLGVNIVDRVATISVPNADWNGSETITFTATDPGGLSAQDTVTFTVTPVNDAPVVGNIPNQTIIEGGSFITINLDNYVTDIDNSAAEMTWVPSGNSQLIVSIVNRVATITTPNVDWNGTETITFLATDPGGSSAGDAATFTVTAVNDPPVVSGIPNQTIAEGGSFTTINLDNYVTDVDNSDAVMTWNSSGNSQLSVTIINRVATISVPDADWNGAETITFQATDPGGLQGEDAATFTVTAVNDAPVAVNDSFTAIEDTVLNIHAPGVLGNDSDIDGDNLTAVKLSDPSHGTLTLNADGSFIYTPAPYFNGVDSFNYRAFDGTANSNTATVRLNVGAVNNAPVCSTVNLTLDEDTTGEASPACTDVEGDTMSYSILTPPSHGVVLLVAGKLRYTPKTNFNGADSFTYKANDGSLDSNVSSGLVSVTPVNDAPLLSPIGDKAVNEMSLLSFSAHATDVDGDKLSFSLDSGAPVGASIQPDSGLFSWTPSEAQGPGSYPATIRVSDGVTSAFETITITVAEVNLAPVANEDVYSSKQDLALSIPVKSGVLANDQDADGDELIAALINPPEKGVLNFNTDGSFTYTPVAGFLGTVTFTYRSYDGELFSGITQVRIVISDARQTFLPLLQRGF